ncbi:MAG: SdrD B-like domain-containing protein, partial [Usitatibacter sp.]
MKDNREQSTGRVGRWARWFAACALAAACSSHAAPAPGTPINNQASATATAGATALTPISNIVSAIVSGGPPANYSAQLVASNQVQTRPGATVRIPHTLTNTGLLTDGYTLAAVITVGGSTISTVQLFADANNDGVPDSATPIAGPVVLAPGAVFHFIAVYTVSAGAQVSATGVARISAASAGGATITPVTDTLLLRDPTVTIDCGIISKILSRDRGPSPAGPVTVTLGYGSCETPRSKIVLTDRIPAGMKYVAGSGRWTNASGIVLTDAGIDDRQGAVGTQIAYDFNLTTAGAVTATVFNIPDHAGGFVTFDIEVDSGLAIGTLIPNFVDYIFYDAAGGSGKAGREGPATYLVTGKANFDLTGQTLTTVTPGSTAVFTNVLHNKGDIADIFDITLSGSTFPPGTTFALFKADGVTPLADTNGSGIPDTGVVAAGGTYNIIVKALIPATAAPGAYKITKTARSAANPLSTASDDDKVDTIASSCAISLDPDNNAQIGFGQHVTYTHYLTNRGNCTEIVRAMIDYIRDSRPGWTSRVYVDNPVPGGASVPGVLDRGDVEIIQGWTTTLAPGQSLRILVDVLAPTQDEAQAAKSKTAKAAIGDSNLTTLQLTPATGPTLVVHDTTIVKAGDGPPEPQDVIRNFTDGQYLTPTGWGVIGGNLYLKADAGSCNAIPGTAETRVVVLTGPNGEREEVNALETGPNTGVFVVASLPVRSPPVTAMNGIIEGQPNDVFDVQIVGCGKVIATTVTLMSASSVVFDSRTNEPVPGATVTLVNANGGQCSTAPASISGGGNPAVTGADGRFAFPQVTPGSYCLSIAAPNGYSFPSQVNWPQLPGGRNLNVSGLRSGGSYGSAFTIGANGLLVVDVPVDPAAQAGLFVQKDVSRSIAELGEFVDYTVRVRNSTGNALDRADVILVDDLPAGFAYVSGTARRDGTSIANPQGGAGPRLTLRIGTLASGAQAVITYRVRLGPGALQGDGINRAQASYAANGVSTFSNVATARVQVTGGVFTDKGYILGKVFLDCNTNGLQDSGELGVPGVRVLLEDGTFAITDGGGKYSFYGIINRTHVVKADRTTLPEGARLISTSSRNLGDAGSRIVDLKSGELQRADFAIEGCAEPVAASVKKRIDAVGKGDELSALFGSALTTQPIAVTDVKALPASGIVQATPAVGLTQTTTNSVPPAPGQMLPVMPGTTDTRPSPAPRLELALATETAGPALEPLESVLPNLDNKLGFIGLKDGDTLPYGQATVRVKGTAGARFRLQANGVDVPDNRIGKRAVLQDKQSQAWEYFGVSLRPGENLLTVSQLDSFGNARGSETIRVIAPDKLGRIVLEVPNAGGIADGRTPVIVVVKLADERGTPVTVRTPVTLETSLGRWKTTDLNPAEPGLQIMVEGGRAEVELLPPLEPASTQIAASNGKLRAEARLDFLPELRQMIATGVLEGIVNLRNVGGRALVPVRESDGFEQELKHISRDWNDGKTQAGARAAFYLKGKIKGDYLLTAAYDSDKDTKERLFRDIQPDEFYPIYGDSSVRGFDAQSTSKLYVRIDNKRSYLLWGDFTTQTNSETRKLTNYSRSLTGVRQHYENDRVSVNAFASRDSTRQVIEELRANGTSGPYTLGTPGAVVNSEKIEIVTRDRNQPALILSSTALARFSDYEIEALTGRILFKAPVPSVDRDLNPVFVRATYEVDQGGEQFWVGGVDAQVKLGDRVEVGAMYVKDKNPLAPYSLAGGNLTVKVAEGTFIIGEAARSESGLESKTGDAARIELKHESAKIKANAYVARSDRDFDNPGAYLTQGRGESGGKLEYKLSDRTTIRAEALRTEDVSTNSVRDGLAAAIQYQLAERLTFELGVRHAAEKGVASAVPSIPAPGGGITVAQPIPDEVTTVRARLTGSLPQVEGLSMYGEAEFDVQDAGRKVLAAGGEYQLPNKGRIYARHEFISSITGPYGLNTNERQNTSAIGVDTEYMKEGKLFSEYRIRNAIAGGDTEAAVGLR